MQVDKPVLTCRLCRMECVCVCACVRACSESEWAELDAEPTYAEVSRAVRKVAKGKAAGEDLITVELLQSKACIEWLHRVVVATWRGEEAPRDWQDGIVVPLYKGKGSRQECDNSCGIEGRQRRSCDPKVRELRAD